jgi:hypothetical protein
VRAGGIDLGKRRFTIASIPVGVRRPTPAVVTVKTKIPDPLDAARHLADRLEWYVEETPEFSDLRVVYLEEPWGGQRQQLVELGTVLGVLAGALPREMLVRKIPPDEWRHALGVPTRGSSVKYQTQLYAQAACAGGPWDEDESDAIAIALVASAATELSPSA